MGAELLPSGLAGVTEAAAPPLPQHVLMREQEVILLLAPMPSSVQPVSSPIPCETRPVYQAKSESSPLIAIFILFSVLFLFFLISLFLISLF
jgi:hypothetical protein